MVKNKKSSLTPKRAFVISAFLATVLISSAAVVKHFYLDRYIMAAHSAETVSIRELILNAARGVKTDAPVDPKTGDVYFPQAKLFLPHAGTNQLTYAFDNEGEHGPELTISSRPVFDQAAAKLYSARNVDEVFDAVPHLQSCQRGVKLTHTELPGTMAAHIVSLNNGTSLYVYPDADCPELGDLVELVKSIQAY